MRGSLDTEALEEPTGNFDAVVVDVPTAAAPAVDNVPEPSEFFPGASSMDEGRLKGDN